MYLSNSFQRLRSAAVLGLGLALAPSAMAEGEAKNVIFFVGDGMGVSTVTAARIYSVGIDKKLFVDKLPYTALSRVYTADHITPDSAATMTEMMSGKIANSGVIGYGKRTERRDFNGDGDRGKVWTLLERAKQARMKVGVVSTARATHATPAATYAHVNERGLENDIALQALPTDASYNRRLVDGLDLLMGGGRRHFVPDGVADEEGSNGRRGDGRDLRAEYQAAGYTYVWNEAQFNGLRARDLPVLGLFESSHMEYEYDRPNDAGGEPSLTDMTKKAIKLLQQTSKEPGYFLMVESGRIDHAHHAGNAWRNLNDTEEFDEAIAAAARMVDLDETLIIVTADHSHVFNIAGYPLRPENELPYVPTSVPADYSAAPHDNILDLVYDLNASTGEVVISEDANGVPYTTLVYGNGSGYRGAMRMDPRTDPTPGYGGVVPAGPNDPAYRQEAAVPLSSETHSAEEVAIYAIGPGAHYFKGTVKNGFIYHVMKKALGL